jgi:hypothetical protein
MSPTHPLERTGCRWSLFFSLAPTLTDVRTYAGMSRSGYTDPWRLELGAGLLGSQIGLGAETFPIEPHLPEEPPRLHLGGGHSPRANTHQALLRSWLPTSKAAGKGSEAKRSVVSRFLAGEPGSLAIDPYPLTMPYEALVLCDLRTDRHVELHSVPLSGGLEVLFWMDTPTCTIRDCHNRKQALSLRVSPADARQTLSTVDFDKAMERWPWRAIPKLCHRPAQGEKTKCEYCKNKKARGKLTVVSGEAKTMDTECGGGEEITPAKRPFGTELGDTNIRSQKQLAGAHSLTMFSTLASVTGPRPQIAYSSSSSGSSSSAMSTQSFMSDSKTSVCSGAGTGISDTSLTSAPGLNQRMAFMAAASRHLSNAHIVVSHPEFHDLVDLPKLLKGPLVPEDVRAVSRTVLRAGDAVATCNNCGLMECDAHDPSIESLKQLCLNNPNHHMLIAHCSLPAKPSVVDPMCLWNVMGIPPASPVWFAPTKGQKRAQLPLNRGISQHRNLEERSIPRHAFKDSPVAAMEAFVEVVGRHYPKWLQDALPGHSVDDQLPEMVGYSGDCTQEIGQCCSFHCQYMVFANRGAAVGFHIDCLPLQAFVGSADRSVLSLPAQRFQTDLLRLHGLRDLSHPDMFTDKDFSTWKSVKAALNRYRSYVLREHSYAEHAAGKAGQFKGWLVHSAVKMAAEEQGGAPHINQMVFAEADAFNLLCEGGDKFVVSIYVNYTPRTKRGPGEPNFWGWVRELFAEVYLPLITLITRIFRLCLLMFTFYRSRTTRVLSMQSTCCLVSSRLRLTGRAG